MPNRMLGPLAAIICLAILGCRESPPPLAPPDQTYTVLARLVAKPAADTYLQMHHAAIPEFRSQAGQVVGMKEMVMEFAELTADASAAVAPLAPGDGVEITFEVRWKSDPRMLVTRVRKLEPGAELGLKKSLSDSDQK
ncbi:MAG: hypothetical protein ACOYN0_06330 [Phycisphaerales bacterium]